MKIRHLSAIFSILMLCNLAVLAQTSAFNFDQGSVGYYFSPESNQGIHEIIFDLDCLMYKMNRDGSNLTFLYPTSVPQFATTISRPSGAAATS